MATPPPTGEASAPTATTTPGRTRLARPRRDPERPPHQRRRRTRRILASEGVFDSIVSLAGLLGRPVRNQTGQEIGRLDDVVARWADGQVYPPVSGLVIRVGRRLAFVGASAIDSLGHAEVTVAVGAPRPARRRAPARGGVAGQGRLGPPAGRRRGRPGHPGRRPLSGRGHRPHPACRRRRLERDPAAPARAAPLAAAPHARPGDRLGRDPALQRVGASGTVPTAAPVTCASHHQRGAAPPAPGRAGRPARGPASRRAARAAGRAQPRRGGRRVGGDAARRPRAAAARVRPGRGGAAARRDGARRGGDALRDLPLAVQGEVLRHMPAHDGVGAARAPRLPRGRGRRVHDHHAGRGQVR